MPRQPPADTLVDVTVLVLLGVNGDVLRTMIERLWNDNEAAARHARLTGIPWPGPNFCRAAVLLKILR
jgi:hypothetical protein